MAQHNEARICGFVTSKAVTEASDGTKTVLMMVRTCIRDNVQYDGRGFFDVQVFHQYTPGEEASTPVGNLNRAVEEASEGDFVDITGTCVLLKGMQISYICVACGNEEAVELKPSIAVVPRYMYVCEEGLPQSDQGVNGMAMLANKITYESMEELKAKFGEISNRVVLVGAVLTDPVFIKKVNKETKEKKVSASYMLGVDRHYRLPYPFLTNSTNDSFFVKSLGSTAYEDRNHIIASKPGEEGTVLLVDGFIFSRVEETFKHKCSHCGATQVVESKVPMMHTAIIPYATEYMGNYKKEEKEGEED